MRWILLCGSYVWRTSSVRALWVAVVGTTAHTRHMGARATERVFVTDPVGFVGSELVKFLVARGHQVFGLTRSPEAAERVRRAGATAIMGDLLTPGRWQDEAAADWVFHLTPQAVDQPRARWRAARVARALVLMNSNLLDAAALLRLAIGSRVPGGLEADAVLSNIRLRGYRLSLRLPHGRAGTSSTRRNVT